MRERRQRCPYKAQLNTAKCESVADAARTGLQLYPVKCEIVADAARTELQLNPAKCESVADAARTGLQLNPFKCESVADAARTRLQLNPAKCESVAANFMEVEKYYFRGIQLNSEGGPNYLGNSGLEGNWSLVAIASSQCTMLVLQRSGNADSFVHLRDSSMHRK